MKIIVVLLAGMLVLSGCTTTRHHHNDVPHDYSEKGNSLMVSDIPDAATDALGERGITDIAVITVLDKQGRTHILKARDVTGGQNVRFPIATTAIEGVEPISVIRFKGSNCLAYFVGGVSRQFCW